MRKSRSISALILAVGLGLAACSQDVGGEPADQGAGRPGDPTDAPAEDVLKNAAGHPAHQDTTAAGMPGMTATQRDTAHSNEGEAIPSVNQPKPDRPNEPSTTQPGGRQ